MESFQVEETCESDNPCRGALGGPVKSDTTAPSLGTKRLNSRRDLELSAGAVRAEASRREEGRGGRLIRRWRKGGVPRVPEISEATEYNAFRGGTPNVNNRNTSDTEHVWCSAIW